MSRASTVLALVMGSTAIPVTAQAGAVPLPLLVKKKKKKRKNKNAFTPEQAADRRMPVQDQGRQMVEAGELTAATILFDGAARTQGDPVLFLDAADAYLELATTERDIASAETAKLRAQAAQDILYFERDPEASDSDYRLVTDSEIPGLLSRAEILLERADATIDEIETELEALEAAEPASARPPGNGRGLRIAGLGLTGLGVAGLGLGVAGLVIGRVNQNRVDDPTVYGTEFDDFDARGRRGNVLAGVGLAVGGVALAAGVTMFIIGRNRGERAGSSSDSVALVPTGRGVALVGRF